MRGLDFGDFENNIQVSVFRNIEYQGFLLEGSVNDISFSIRDDCAPLMYYQDSEEFDLIISNFNFTLKLRLIMFPFEDDQGDFVGRVFRIIKGNLDSKYFYFPLEESCIYSQAVRKVEKPGFTFQQPLMVRGSYPALLTAPISVR